MSDEQHGDPALQLIDRRAEVLRSRGVQTAGDLIENQRFRTLNQRTCDRHPLLLTTGQSDPALSNLHLIPVWKSFNRVVYFRYSARPGDLLKGRARIRGNQIAVNRSREEHRLLCHDSEVRAHLPWAEQSMT
jgi:hypothetical protein